MYDCSFIKAASQPIIFKRSTQGENSGFACIASCKDDCNVHTVLKLNRNSFVLTFHQHPIGLVSTLLITNRFGS